MLSDRETISSYVRAPGSLSSLVICLWYLENTFYVRKIYKSKVAKRKVHGVKFWRCLFWASKSSSPVELCITCLTLPKEIWHQLWNVIYQRSSLDLLPKDPLPNMCQKSTFLKRKAGVEHKLHDVHKHLSIVKYSYHQGNVYVSVGSCL